MPRPRRHAKARHFSPARGEPVPCRSDAHCGHPALRSLVRVHRTQARGEPVPSRRTLTAGILPSVRSMLARSRHPAFARQQRRLHGTGSPLANPDSARERNRSPPARAGGTAGCWAAQLPITANRSPPTRPIRVHHQPAPGTSPTLLSPAGRRVVGRSRFRPRPYGPAITVAAGASRGQSARTRWMSSSETRSTRASFSATDW
jgi:hypothetical protein